MSTIAHHECRHSSDAKRNQPAFFLLVFLVSSIVNQSSSQAELPALLKDRPWLHAVSDRGEWWISAERQVAAFRVGDQHFTFLNLEADEIDEYQVSRGVIRRSRLRASQKDMTYVVFELLKGNENVDWPPSGNFIPTRTNSRIEIEGKKYTQIDFDLNEVTTTLVIKVTFRIDPETKLIESWTISSSDGDELKSKIDYLKEGPVDIYALGAPRDAKVINRIPSEKVQQIIDQVESNRDHLSPYTVYIFESSNNTDEMAPLRVVYRMKRHGSRFLLDRSSGKNLEDLKSTIGKDGMPTEEKDQVDWWKTKIDSLRFVPIQLFDGKTSHHFFPADGGPNESASPRFSSTVVINPAAMFDLERLNYQSVYEPADEVENLFDSNPPVGPTGMALITQRKSPTEVSRTWVDPKRGFVAVRHEDEEKGLIQVTVAEQFKQSTTGIWYAARVRTGCVNSPGEKLGDAHTDKYGNVTRSSVVNYLLDFDSPIPDDLFKRTTAVRYPMRAEDEAE